MYRPNYQRIDAATGKHLHVFYKDALLCHACLQSPCYTKHTCKGLTPLHYTSTSRAKQRRKTLTSASLQISPPSLLQLCFYHHTIAGFSVLPIASHMELLNELFASVPTSPDLSYWRHSIFPFRIFAVAFLQQTPSLKVLSSITPACY